MTENFHALIKEINDYGLFINNCFQHRNGMMWQANVTNGHEFSDFGMDAVDPCVALRRAFNEYKSKYPKPVTWRDKDASDLC